MSCLISILQLMSYCHPSMAWFIAPRDTMTLSSRRVIVIVVQPILPYYDAHYYYNKNACSECMPVTKCCYPYSNCYTNSILALCIVRDPVGWILVSLHIFWHTVSWQWPGYVDGGEEDAAAQDAGAHPKWEESARIFYNTRVEDQSEIRRSGSIWSSVSLRPS